MRKRYIDILYWLILYLFWLLVFQKRAFTLSQTATVQFCYLLFVAGNYYLNARYNIPRFLQTRKHLQFALVLGSGIIAAAALRVPVAMFLNKNFFIPGRPQPAAAFVFTDSLINIGIWVICIVAAKLVVDRFRFQQHLDEVKKQKEQAELDFLNAQFNPHFLFNSLNSIYGHIDKQNTTARSMLLSFSDMLRYQLYECNENAVLIDRELNYLRNYVELQRMRKDPKLQICVDIPEDLKGFRISPLLFIAFIENSFKYLGAGNEAGDFVSISFSKTNGELAFLCRNSVVEHIAKLPEHKGIGISNARRRLELLYPARHKLSISDNKKIFEVDLKIAIDET
jgi:LytS/YehU family sensor histidine kinase